MYIKRKKLVSSARNVVSHPKNAKKCCIWIAGAFTYDKVSPVSWMMWPQGSESRPEGCMTNGVCAICHYYAPACP